MTLSHFAPNPDAQTAFPTEVPVLIVGGGPVGLTSALLLARQGVRSLLIERHPGTSIHPRARGLNIRTMEIFRSLGLEGAIRAAGASLDRNRYLLWVETLAGAEIRRIPVNGGVDEADRVASISPTNWAACAQDDLEPILATEAHERGADLRFGAELLRFDQDDAGVTATVLDRATGAQHQVRARYLIAADGAASPIRAALGVERQGLGTLAHDVGIYFRSDLTDLVDERWFVLCFVESPEVRGLLLSVNNTDRWVLHVPYDPAQTPVSDFTPERCIDLVRKAVGVPDLPVEILSVLPWEAAGGVADAFRIGNVLLAGDAAHVMPPAGAFGMNTGVQDAHNLAWKLAAVLRGAAPPAFLDTYERDRRTVAQLTVEHTVQNEAQRFVHTRPGRTNLGSVERSNGVADPDAQRPAESGGPAAHPGGQPVDELAIMLGYSYPVTTASAPNLEPHTLAGLARIGLRLDGTPGFRAPHIWLTRLKRRLSTLDLFGDRFVLLAGPGGGVWCRAFEAAAAERNLPLDTYWITPPGAGGDLIDPDDSWSRTYHLGDSGVVLVRPDGFVAWRCAAMARAPGILAETVLDAALCQTRRQESGVRSQ